MPMKIFVASDLHGSAVYCEKMLRAYDREQADRLLLLGDLLYHGPRNDLPEGYQPKRVLAMLNDYKQQISCVRGKNVRFSPPTAIGTIWKICRRCSRGIFSSMDIPMYPPAGRRRACCI